MKRLRLDKRGVSNVIVVMLSLVLVVIIVANVVLWSYQMNQLDWEKNTESIKLADVSPVTNSSWFTNQNEYTANVGSCVNGTYAGTQNVGDGLWETFQETQQNTLGTTGTSTTSQAVQYLYQRKSFHANGRFWVFYSDGANLVYRSSTDGLSWGGTTIVRASFMGYYFSVWFDGTYVHYVCGRGIAGEALLYRRGTPNTDGTITWSTPLEQTVCQAVPTVSYYRRQTRAENKLWVMDGSYSTTANYTTEIVTGNTSASNYYLINPFTNQTIANGTSLPSNVLLQGWRTSTRVTLKESGYRVDGVARNRDASAHAGRVYARLWKSQYSNMSNSVAISGWQYATVTFTATAGEERSFSVYFEVTNPPNNEYLYVEFAWYISTASSSQTAGLYLRAETSNSFTLQYGWAYNYPYVSTDSNGFPFISYTRSNYYAYPFVVKSSLNNGTWQTSSGFPYKLQTSSSTNWRTTVLPLAAGKAYVIYTERLTVYGRLWDGSGWSTEETITTTDLQLPQYFSAVCENDNIHIVFLTASPYNINYRKRTYGTGWETETTIQASTTSTSAPALSINTANGDLYCLWAGSPTASCIYCKKCVHGLWDTFPTKWVEGQPTQSLETGNDLDENIFGPYWKAQSFTTLKNDTVWRVETYAKRGLGTASIPINVAIYYADAQGKPTGTPLGSGTIASFTGTTYAWRTCVFSSPVSVSANQKYCLVISAPTGSPTQYYNWAVDSTSPPYVNGNWAYSDDSGSIWTADASKDCLFRVLFESSLVANDCLTSYFKDTDGRTAAIFVTKTASPYDVKQKFLNLAQPMLDFNGTFSIDINSYPLPYVHGIEIQLRFKARYGSERVYLKAFNWTSMTYSDNGFNLTTGQTPTTSWSYYCVKVTQAWRSYVRDDGTIRIKLQDQGLDINQTIIDVDFLGVRALLNGSRFTFRNDGALTTHVIAIWINNATHVRYPADLFINSGEQTVRVRVDIALSSDKFVAKIVTERGNMAVFAKD